MIFGGRCRYDEVICSEMTRWGAGARYQICSVQMLAPLARPHPALRTTFPLEGEGSFGGAWLYVIPLNNGDPAPPPALKPSGAKGKILRRHPTPRLKSPFGKVPRIPKLHRKGHPKRTTYRNVHTSRVPFAVKFLEFLEPSPKEGSKRGLGRRPKVFSSGSKRGLGRRPKVFPSLTPSSHAGWCGRGRGRTPSEGCGACRARRAPATRRHPRARRQ